MPFSSRRRWSAVRLDGVTYVLGAPELLPLGELAERVGEEARAGRRVLGLARTRSPLAASGPEPPLPSGLELLGVVVLSERLRAHAAETIAFFHEQGVRLEGPLRRPARDGRGDRRGRRHRRRGRAR